MKGLMDDPFGDATPTQRKIREITEAMKVYAEKHGFSASTRSIVAWVPIGPELDLMEPVCTRREFIRYELMEVLNNEVH